MVTHFNPLYIHYYCCCAFKSHPNAKDRTPHKMNVWAFDVHKFLSSGIDPSIVLTVQLLRNLSVLDDSPQRPVLSAVGSFPSVFNGRSFYDAMDEQTILGTVRCAVSCCAFFHGFEAISDTAADQLTTVIVNKLDVMAKQLRTLADQQRMRGHRPTTSFKNPAHQVLETHALPASVLLTFYNSRVIRPCRAIAEKWLSSHCPLTENSQNNILPTTSNL